MSIFSGVYSSERNVVTDEVNNLVLSCNSGSSSLYHLRDNDIIGGTYASLPADQNVIINIRTINYSPANEVINERRPAEPWWEDDGNDEDEEAPEDFEGEVEESTDEPEPERTITLRESGHSSPREIRIVGSGRGRSLSEGNPLRDYADMVNRSMVWDSERAAERFSREALREEPVIPSPEPAIERQEPAHTANPQRRPVIRRGGRRRW